MIFYFSATGNSKYVAERLATATEENLISIEEAMKDKRFVYEANDEDRIGFVMPTYYYGLPKIVEEFLDRVQLFTKKHHYVYHVLTMGGSTGNAGRSFRKLMAGNGMKVDASFSVKFPDTWTPLFDLSDKENVRRILEEAEPLVGGICEKVKARAIGDFDSHKGVWRIFSTLTRISYYGQTTDKFAVSESCVGCGLCASGCPDSTISIVDGKPVWVSDKCDFCLRCLHRCPKFAISFGRNTHKHGQYVNPNVEI